MEALHLTKGFKIRLAGMPDTSIIPLPQPRTVGLSALDIPHIRARLTVREGDPVRTGTPLFCDKRDPAIQYVSPGTGTVRAIRFGDRRRLQEVVIGLSGPDDPIRFEPVSLTGLSALPRETLVNRLKQGGVWQHLRQLPARDTADSSRNPPLIIVSLEGNDPCSPHPELVLKDRRDTFAFGLSLLRMFSARIIVTARARSLDLSDTVAAHVTHRVPDTYPAWDPAVVLYHIKTSAAENPAWYCDLQGLLRMAGFLQTGAYPTDTLITVTRKTDSRPHLATRVGAPIRHLAGYLEPDSLITTGRFNGRMVDPDSHLGSSETTLNILETAETEELFGFIRPGLTRPTASHTFVSRLFDGDRLLDGTRHGEERACINCGYCENICPVDLMPGFILKALISDDVEEALQLGLMDCSRCGMCAYTCPSKIELTHILSRAMDAYHKDKNPIS